MPFEFVDEEPKPKSRFEFVDEESEESQVLPAKISFEKGYPVISEQTGDNSWRDILQQAYHSVPSSAYETGKSLMTPIVHPIETGKVLGKTAIGGVQKLTPGTQEYEQAFDAVVEAMKGRYGSIENLKKTFATDPVGLATDIASFLVPVGGIAKGAGIASKIGTLEKAGGIVSKVGMVTEPLNIAKEALSPLRYLVPKGIPSKLYQSGAKFSTTIPIAKRNILIQTALDNSILPTIRGLEKTRDLIDNLNTEITAKIDALATPGTSIPVTDLFKYFDELKDKARLSGEPMRNMKTIDRIKASIIKANRQSNITSLTPQEVQTLKQRIYKDLESYYSSMKDSPVSVATQKSVAKAAKESLENLIPEIKQLNATEGELIELRKVLERSANRITNRDLIGIGTPIKTGVGGVVHGTSGAITGLALGILDTPQVKTRIAIALNKLRKRGVQIKPTATATRLGLYQAGNLEEVETE